MDNKENRTLEEKQIDELLSQFEGENIEIPKALDDRLNSKLEELRPKKYKKWMISSAAVIMVMVFSYNFIMPFRSFADTMFKYIFGDIGIENAVNNGYESADSKEISIGKYDMIIENIYMDNQRINFDVVMKTELEDFLDEENVEGNQYGLCVDPAEDEDFESVLQNGIFYKDGGEIKANIKIVGEGVDDFLKNKDSINLKLTLEKYICSFDAEEQKTYILGEKNLELEIPKNIPQNQVIKINKAIKDGKLDFEVRQLEISPTLMYIDTIGKVDGMGDVQGLDNFRIISDQGNVYKNVIEVSGIGMLDGGWKQTIVPSIYYDQSEHFKLKADGVIVDASKKIKINLKDNAPREIDYFGYKITISDISYEDGELTVEFKTDKKIAYISASTLDGNISMSSNYYSGAENEANRRWGVTFEVDKKDNYELDLRLGIKYKYPIDIDIKNINK